MQAPPRADTPTAVPPPPESAPVPISNEALPAVQSGGLPSLGLVLMGSVDVVKADPTSWHHDWASQIPPPPPRKPTMDKLAPLETREGTFKGRRGTDTAWLATSFTFKKKPKSKETKPPIRILRTEFTYKEKVCMNPRRGQQPECEAKL
jgi:hypothetical protein